MRLVSILLTLALACIIGVLLYQATGNVTITYEQWLLKFPLWVGFAGIVGLILAIWIVLTGTMGIINLFKDAISYFKNINAQHSKIITTQAILDLVAGNYKLAEKNLIKNAKTSPVPLLNYLAAAYAATKLQATDRRDTYLMQAMQIAPEAGDAIAAFKVKLK